MKGLSFLLASLLATASIVGCGSSNADAQPDSGTPGAQAAPPGTLKPPADLPGGAMKKGKP